LRHSRRDHWLMPPITFNRFRVVSCSN